MRQHHYFWRYLLLLALAVFSCSSAWTTAPPTKTTNAAAFSTWTRGRGAASPLFSTTTTTESSSTTTTSSSLQQLSAGKIASSFQPRDFKPLVSNNHFQTIAGFAFRTIPEFLYVNKSNSVVETMATALFQKKDNIKSSSFWNHRERLETPDQDWFHVDYAYYNNDTTTTHQRPLVLLLHGLESSSDSSLIVDMATSYMQYNKMNVACLNFRGCSGEPNDTLGGYHLGFTSDLLHFLNILKDRYKTAMPPIYLSGFSLGGNVVLKALGELGEDAVNTYNIKGAAVFCVPLDASRNAPVLCSGTFNKLVYNQNFLNTLRRRCRDQLERYCGGNPNTDRFDYPRAMSANTITEFDDAFVAPVYGYKDAWHYYHSTSSVHFLESICVPTLVLNARDDPFMDPTYLPVEKTQEGGGRAPVKLVGAQHGGHCGFILHQVESDEEVSNVGFASVELSRFFKHVQESGAEEG